MNLEVFKLALSYLCDLQHSTQVQQNIQFSHVELFISSKACSACHPEAENTR